MRHDRACGPPGAARQPLWHGQGMTADLGPHGALRKTA
jgi:hypothetical protein